EMARRPIRGAAADIEQEVVEDLAAARRVRHLRVKQHAVDRLRVVLHAGDRRVGARRGHPKMGGRRLDPVAVARPDDDGGLWLESRKETLVLPDRDVRTAIFADRGGGGLPARE